MKNDDFDEVRIPSSKNRNESKATNQFASDIQALQQQYEALIAGESLSSINSAVYNSSNGSIDSGSISNDQKSRKEQELFEGTCNIPSEIILILKKESLWTNNTYSVHVPTILTSTERKRRSIEIELLQNLIHNDDETVHQLWLLWYTERDTQENATAELYAATTFLHDPNTWDMAEQILRQLVLQHGIYWVEPLNRLATLYYLQGKYQQSIDLCNVILYVKPWHVGALSGMVGLYIQTNDMTQAKKWSEKRLPSYVPDHIQGSKNSNQRRVEWVKKAVTDAKLSLYNAEQQLQSSFGKKDPPQSTPSERNDAIPILDVDATSWQ